MLADWGADVIKVEHPVMGDAQRGLQAGPASYAVGSFAPIMEHPNRGKRSIGLALDNPPGSRCSTTSCRTADVFLTNFLPTRASGSRIDVEHMQAVNPKIIYVRGSAFGAARSRGREGRLRLERRSGRAAAVAPA